MVDQRKLLNDINCISAESLPRSIEQQHLARNLEMLRLKGERFLVSCSVRERNNAMSIVNLMASHPIMLLSPRACDVVIDTEVFLSRLAGKTGNNESLYGEWEELSRRLNLVAEELSVESINAAHNEIISMGEVVEASQKKLCVALFITVLFVALILFFVHRRLVVPVQRVARTLLWLGKKPPDLRLPTPTLYEIRLVESAIQHLHESLQESKRARKEVVRNFPLSFMNLLRSRPRMFVNACAANLPIRQSPYPTAAR